jgi:tellurite resistance protein TerC
MDFQHVIAWGAFLAVVLVMLAVDLFVLHRKPHAIQMKEALLGAAVPVGVALLFTVAIFYAYQNKIFHLGVIPPNVADTPAAKFFPDTGSEAVLMYLTGYLVELSLSADNVFLFVILMAFFKVPRELQHRVLFWGVLGALVMRGIMIGAAAYLTRFEIVIYLFGLFLVYAGVKMLFSGEPKDPSDNLAVKLVRKLFPFKDGFDGKKFFTVENGKRVATTLFLVLVCIEFTDLVFALDSIPAIFGITRDSFIVFTSNVFAILGLRSLYFLLAGVMDKFHLLKYGLAVVLGFVGVKMVLPGAAEVLGHFTHREYHWEVDKMLSLGVIVLALAGSVVASLLFPSKAHHRNPLEDEAATATPAPRPPTMPAS